MVGIRDRAPAGRVPPGLSLSGGGRASGLRDCPPRGQDPPRGGVGSAQGFRPPLDPPSQGTGRTGICWWTCPPTWAPQADAGGWAPLCHLDLATFCFSVPSPLWPPFFSHPSTQAGWVAVRGEKGAAWWGPSPGWGSRQAEFKSVLLLTC